MKVTLTGKLDQKTRHDRKKTTREKYTTGRQGIKIQSITHDRARKIAKEEIATANNY